MCYVHSLRTFVSLLVDVFAVSCCLLLIPVFSEVDGAVQTISCSSAPILINTSATSYEVSTCGDVPLTFVMSEVSNVSLRVVASWVSQFLFRSSIGRLEGIDLFFVNCTIRGSGGSVMSFNSMRLYNVTIRWQMCNITLVSILTNNAMALVTVEASTSAAQLHIRIVECAITFTSSVPQTTANVGSLFGSVSESDVIVRGCIITSWWPYNATDVLLGYSFSVQVLEVLGGAEQLHIQLSDINMTIIATSMVAIVYVSGQSVVNSTVVVAAATIAVEMGGPRGSLQVDSAAPFVFREFFAVLFEVAYCSEIFLQDVHVQIVFRFNAAPPNTDANIRNAMTDQNSISLTRCNGINLSVAVDNCGMDVFVRDSPGGPAGIIVIMSTALIVLLPDASNVPLEFRLKARNVTLRVTNSRVNAVMDPLSFCAIDHYTILQSTLVSTAVNGVAIVVSAVSVATHVSTLTVALENVTVSSKPPRLDLCPTGGGHVYIGFPLFVVIPAANASVVCAFSFGSAAGYVLTLLDQLCSGSPLLASFRNDIPAVSPIVVEDSTVNSYAVAVTANLAFQPLVIGLDPNSSLVPCHFFFVWTDFVGHTDLRATNSGGHMKTDDISVFGPLGLVAQQVAFAGSDCSITMSSCRTPPSVAIFLLLDVGTSSSSSTLAPACRLVASDFLGEAPIPVSAVVVARNLTVPLAWVFHSIAWLKYFDDNKSASMFLMLQSPTELMAGSTVDVTCVFFGSTVISDVSAVVGFYLNASQQYSVDVNPCSPKSLTYSTSNTQLHISRSGELSRSLGLMWTPTVDLNASTAGPLRHTTGTAVAVLGALSWFGPGGYFGSLALQRSSLAIKLAARCRVMEVLGVEVDEPLAMGDPLDNPFQLVLHPDGISTSLGAVCGGILGNVLVCLVWGVLYTLVDCAYNSIRGMEGPASIVELLSIFLVAAFGVYTPLLASCYMGSAAALSLRQSAGDVALGVVSLTLWGVPALTLCYKLTIATRGKNFPFLYLPVARVKKSFTTIIAWLFQESQQLELRRHVFPILSVRVLQDLIGEYKPRFHYFICLELLAAVVSGLLSGVGWFSNDCYAFSYALVAVSCAVLAAIMILLPLAVQSANLLLLLLEGIGASISILAALSLEPEAVVLSYLQAILTVISSLTGYVFLMLRRRQFNLRQLQNAVARVSLDSGRQGRPHGRRARVKQTPFKPRRMPILLPEQPPSELTSVQPDSWHRLKIAFFQHHALERGTSSTRSTVHVTEILSILISAAACTSSRKQLQEPS